MQQSRPHNNNLRWTYTEYDVTGLSPEAAAEMIAPGRPQSALDELAALALDTPTERLPVVRVARSTTPVSHRNTEPLPMSLIDSKGRYYLSCNERWTQGPLWDDTLYYIEKLTEEYRKLFGVYPVEICLRAQRYFVRPQAKGKKPGGRMSHFYPRDIHAQPIPFVLQDWHEVERYEIVVRGALPRKRAH